MVTWMLMFVLAHLEPYDRSDYKHWIDADGDCQNTRAETLIRHSTKPVRFATARGCRVVTGLWVDVYSDDILYDAGGIDIDHIIPLGWAHTHGAATWGPMKKEAFANDPDNLVPVLARLNRQKGKKGPDEWRPPSNLCGYAARWMAILRKYELVLTVREFEAIQGMKLHCID